MKLLQSFEIEGMTQHVYEVNNSNGWFDRERTFLEDIVLLHSEVSEAVEAYRSHGMEDFTGDQTLSERMAKPEGIGSEIADLLIRLLDTARRYEIDLYSCREFYLSTEADDEDVTAEELIEISKKAFISMGVITALAEMHQCIAMMGMYEVPPADLPAARFNFFTGELLLAIELFCEINDIDLVDEFHRKMAYNATRGYRHGGKIL